MGKAISTETESVLPIKPLTEMQKYRARSTSQHSTLADTITEKTHITNKLQDIVDGCEQVQITSSRSKNIASKPTKTTTTSLYAAPTTTNGSLRTPTQTNTV
jgi:tRNA C32,U32 (ribose-2'-O)-methylase TrmJ